MEYTRCTKVGTTRSSVNIDRVVINIDRSSSRCSEVDTTNKVRSRVSCRVSNVADDVVVNRNTGGCTRDNNTTYRTCRTRRCYIIDLVAEYIAGACCNIDGSNCRI